MQIGDVDTSSSTTSPFTDTAGKEPSTVLGTALAAAKNMFKSKKKKRPQDPTRLDIVTSMIQLKVRVSAGACCALPALVHEKFLTCSGPYCSIPKALEITVRKGLHYGPASACPVHSIPLKFVQYSTIQQSIVQYSTDRPPTQSTKLDTVHHSTLEYLPRDPFLASHVVCSTAATPWSATAC
jgi:hypothetical protein